MTHQVYYHSVVKTRTLKRYNINSRQNDDYHEVAAFLKFFKIIILIMCGGKAIWVMHISTGSPISSWLLFQLETARHKRHDSHLRADFLQPRGEKQFCTRTFAKDDHKILPLLLRLLWPVKVSILKFCIYDTDLCANMLLSLLLLLLMLLLLLLLLLMMMLMMMMTIMSGQGAFVCALMAHMIAIWQ